MINLPKSYFRFISGLLMLLSGVILLGIFVNEIISFIIEENIQSSLAFIFFPGIPGFLLTRKGIRLIRLAWSSEPVKFITATSFILIIISILGFMTTISYCDYTERAQIAEGISMSNELKAAIADFWNAKGALPENNTVAGLAASTSYQGTYVSSIEVRGGTIEITYGKKARRKISGKTLGIYPVMNQADNLQWVCGFAPFPEGTSEIVLRKLAVTNIDQRYLPNSCRP